MEKNELKSLRCQLEELEVAKNELTENEESIRILGFDPESG
jgi:hypothetical protein